MNKKEQEFKMKVFKPIKELDIEIRTIEKVYDELKDTFYYDVKIGLYESLGEKGQIYTMLFDELPSEESIIQEVREHLIETLREYEEKLLTFTEEKYYEILKDKLK